MKTKSDTRGKNEGPSIFLHSFELTKEIYAITRNFPRPTRFVLGDKIDRLMTEFLLELNSSTSKRADLTNFDKRHSSFTDLSFRLDELRVLLRLAFEIKVLSSGYYKNTLERIDEIGRELGGLIKFNQTQKEKAHANAPRRS